MSNSSSSNNRRIVDEHTTTRLSSLLQRDLFDCGFDIVVPFHPQWYNDCLDDQQQQQEGNEHFKHLLRLPSSNTTNDDDDGNDNTNVDMAEEQAFLIGNTKNLWPFFKAWLREQDDDSHQQHQQQVPETSQENDASSTSLKIINHPHPLDSYCQECIARCVEKHFHQPKLNQQTHNDRKDDDDNNNNEDGNNHAECKPEYTSSSSLSYRIYWSCTFAPDKMVSMQHVAMVSGFAYFDPLTNLCVHPVYGTWHAYRAVLVVMVHPPRTLKISTPPTTTTTTTCTHQTMMRPTSTPPPPPPPPRVPCLLSIAEQECARAALARAMELCTRTTNSYSNNADSTLDDSSRSNTSISSTKKKSCFDLLLHGQDKKKKHHKNVKQEDEDCCKNKDDKNTNSSNQRHDDYDDYDDNDDNDFLSISQAFIDLRDCVQTGKEEYRYEYDQLMYHFTKDKRYLRLD